MSRFLLQFLIISLKITFENFGICVKYFIIFSDEKSTNQIIDLMIEFSLAINKFIVKFSTLHYRKEKKYM